MRKPKKLKVPMIVNAYSPTPGGDTCYSPLSEHTFARLGIDLTAFDTRSGLKVDDKHGTIYWARFTAADRKALIEACEGAITFRTVIDPYWERVSQLFV